MYCLPVHSLLFVKSIPRIRFEDSKPSFLKALVTCTREKKIMFGLTSIYLGYASMWFLRGEIFSA